MNKDLIKRISFTVIIFFISMVAVAQGNAAANSTLDETMRSHSKIYVVMAVCVLILITLFLYLIRIDRKVSRQENKM